MGWMLNFVTIMVDYGKKKIDENPNRMSGGWPMK